ncbi:MAG: hypothetical protein V4549_06675 [Bacteroidota bacterium]
MVKLNKKGKKKYGKYISKKLPGGICGTFYLCGTAAALVNHKIKQVKEGTGAVQYSKQSAIQNLLEELAQIKNFNFPGRALAS